MYFDFLLREKFILKFFRIINVNISVMSIVIEYYMI